jgi:hypothetical protein
MAKKGRLPASNQFSESQLAEVPVLGMTIAQFPYVQKAILRNSCPGHIQ